MERALVDGEAVVFRSGGLSDFEALLTKRGGESALLKGLTRALNTTL